MYQICRPPSALACAVTAQLAYQLRCWHFCEYITPFNVYVPLSRGRGRGNIRLLRDFDENLLMTHPCEYLRLEDERLTRLDGETEKWWKEMQNAAKMLAM